MRVKGHIQEAVGNNNVVLAVGIDVANAFNSISWSSISKALRWRKGFPHYLCRIIDAYLSNRWIEYIDVDGKIRRHQVLAGVPQGSVLEFDGDSDCGRCGSCMVVWWMSPTF